MPKFSAVNAAKLLNVHKVTAMIAVPTMIADLLQHVSHVI